MTEAEFYPLATVFGCPPSPAVERDGLWCAEGTVGQLTPADVAPQHVCVWGDAQEGANVAYRMQAMLLIRRRATLLRAVLEEKRILAAQLTSQVTQVEAAVIALDRLP